MLEVQKYLQTKTFDDLAKELGIKLVFHPTLPFVIANYDQIDSPKTNPVVKECRGLTLHKDTKEVIAKSFSRFYDWGEVIEDMKLFDFSDFAVQSKEDGSLAKVFYYEGQWHAHTRGSFGTDLMQHQTFTWQEGFCKAFGIHDIQSLDLFLDRKYTYIFEFVSPWNKIVRRYEKPAMYLLTLFEGIKELHWDDLAEFDCPLGIKRPDFYRFKSIEEIQTFLQEQASADATFEGVVIRDKNNLRYKIKNATYLALHRLKGEGDNLFNPKHLLPFIMSGEDDELLLYFPEVRETYFEFKEKITNDYNGLIDAWTTHKHIEDQKTFALAVKDKTPYTAILFNLRKKFGMNQSLENLRKEWRDSEAQILKRFKL